MIVSIWCGAARFAHADITRLDATLVRLFDWGRAAGHQAIVRLFQRVDQGSATPVQSSRYRGLFDKLHLKSITLDVDSSVITRWGSQMQGAAKGYNPKNHGRASHHPLLAFVADGRLVANCWLRPGNTNSLNNARGFLQETRSNLGPTVVGLFRAQRLVAVRQHRRRKEGGVPGKTLSLFADDPDLQGWRYGAIWTDLSLPAVEAWRRYRGRADCENRIKALKADFGLDSFVLRDFWATEAALGVTMLAYHLMSVFRHAVMRQNVPHTLATLHHQVLALGAFWDNPNIKPDRPTLRVAVARPRRHWFEGPWASAGEPVNLNPA